MEPRMPLELVAMVVDYLQADKPSLSSCCLVSRRWLHFCRAHLFSTLTCYGPFNDLPYNVSPDSSPIPDDVAPFVYSLIFSGTFRDSDTLIHAYVLPSRKLVAIAAALPNLKSVELRGIKVDIDPLLSMLPSVRTRTLTLLKYGDANPTFISNPAQNLYGLFSIFPLLENLSLINTRISGFEITPTQPLLRVLPRPTSLKLHDCYYHGRSIETLTTTIGLTRLQEVSIRAGSGNIRSFGRFLTRTTQTLRHLTFDLKGTGGRLNISPTSVNEFINISQYQLLHTLSIIIRIGRRTTFSAFLAFLPNLPPSIRFIVVNFHFELFPKVGTLEDGSFWVTRDCERIDDALETYPNLRSLTFQLTDDFEITQNEGSENFMATIHQSTRLIFERRLPKIVARSVVHFSSHHFPHW